MEELYLGFYFHKKNNQKVLQSTVKPVYANYLGN